MTISILLISSEKIALAQLLRMAALRAKSIDAVELCVGISVRPARYSLSALPTDTPFTGTLATVRQFTMDRAEPAIAPPARRRSLCSAALRSTRKMSSVVVNVIAEEAITQR